MQKSHPRVFLYTLPRAGARSAHASAPWGANSGPPAQCVRCLQKKPPEKKVSSRFHGSVTRTTGFLARHQNSCSSKSEFFGLNVLFGGIEAQKKIFFQSCSEILKNLSFLVFTIEMCATHTTHTTHPHTAHPHTPTHTHTHTPSPSRGDLTKKSIFLNK